MPAAMSAFLSNRRTAAVLILLAAGATIGGALVMQHGFGYQPCQLCLLQRDPYYLALPVALATALSPPRSVWSRIGLGLLALVFLVSAGLGAYHAGVEWGLWPGPSDCGGAGATQPSGVNDFLRSLERTRVVSCTEAAWRFLGLSLAGWNALISLGLAALASWAAARPDGGLATRRASSPEPRSGG
jgi:disulfide bond formation protein DsbB